MVRRSGTGGSLLAGLAWWSRGFSQWPWSGLFFSTMQDGQPDGQQQQPATAAAAAAALGADQVDRLVRQRLDQAFSSVFGRLVDSSERAAAAAEKQANVAKSDNLVRNLKCEQWRPQSREEELRTWREWYFGFTNYVAGHDPLYEAELREMDVDKEQDHRLMTDDMVARSQRIFSLLCSLLKGRPLLLVRSCEETKAGYEAVRILRNSMEPREKSRSLALMRQLAAWRFDEKGGMHEQLVRYEEALKAYEVSSGQAFPEDLVLATVVGGLKEPLRSQVQLKMTSATKYVDVRSWVLQYESLSTPWGFTAQGKGGSSGNADSTPQPMEVDVIKGKGKGKKGKDGKGKKGKDSKGKGRDSKGKPGDGKGAWQGKWNNGGWNSGGWNSSGQWGANSWNNGGGNWGNGGNKPWKDPKGKGKGGGKKGDSDVCNNCGQRGHWKWECPLKGKGKVNQVDAGGAVPSSAASTLTSTSTTLPSASQYRGSVGVNRVETFACETPPGCRVTQIVDMSELDDEGEFDLDGFGVMTISAGGLEDSFEEEWFPDVAPHVFEHALSYKAAPAFDPGVPTFAMDATDHDDEWLWAPGHPDLKEPMRVQAVVARAGPEELEVVIDSGADISVAPLRFGSFGAPARASNVTMQDAPGRKIKEHCSRTLDLEVETLQGDRVMIREKFAVAKIEALIVSLGRLLRRGWTLGTHHGKPTIEQGGHCIPVRLRRNTLTVLAMVSTIAVSTCQALPDDGPCVRALAIFDDVGPLPGPLEELAAQPGWHILKNGLPVLVANCVEELDLDKLIWSEQDWPYLVAFVRADPATRKPQCGDLWIQVLTLTSEAYGETPRLLAEIDSDLAGKRDVVVLFHVEELSRTLLTSPGDLFAEPGDDGAPFVPDEGEVGDEGHGVGDVGAEAEEVGHGEPMEEEAHEDDELEGVRLHVETPLRVLRELCQKYGLPTSGGKNKVLRRLKEEHEILSRRLSAEVARKMFSESERVAEMPRIPILPSARQQELHNITHQPFQPWCQACLAGRSRQSPHKVADKDPTQEVKEEKRVTPTIQIDYAYTFTKQKHEVQEGEADANRGADGEREPAEHDEPNAQEDVDYQNQHGLTLVGAESTTGWTVAIPIAQKGSASLKRVTEHLVRLSMLISPGEAITFQCDPEAPIKQVVNAVESCRSRLGLATHKVWIPRGSHASNGMAERAVGTIRANALTLKSHLESRIQAAVEGHTHIYSWLMRHASFLFNRFATCVRGAPPYEIVFGRRFKSKMVPFGELVLFHRASKHKGELQWLRGVWVGLNERNGAHILGTPEGVCESRSIRRLPQEQQYSAEAVLGMKGFPWSYLGTAKRRRALYPGGSRVPLLPDSASLEELARAAGRAAAAEIAAGTPNVAQQGDEAASDPSSSTSSSTSASPTSATTRQRRGQPQQEQQQNRQQESQEHPQPLGHGGSQQREQQQNRQQESREHPQPLGPVSMDGVVEHGVSSSDQPGGVPKRPRLLLDRPAGGDPGAASSPSSSLYPPGFAGVRRVHGDVPTEELVGFDGWSEDMVETMALENDAAAAWEEEVDDDKPPDPTPEELWAIDREADFVEVTRLMQMGVASLPKPGEETSGYPRLTTKMVRDWRKRPTWVRRSRLVGREFRFLSEWTAELFAPASSLAMVHSLISVAMARGLEIVTLDVKDAYLNVDQPHPVLIEVDRSVFGEEGGGTVDLVLDKLLPGQRIGASAWFGYAKGLLGEAGMENFAKEPTLFKHTDPGNQSALIMHADDGILASTPEERKRILKVLGAKVKVQVSSPLREPGSEVEFLKRRYVMTKDGVVVYSNGKYLESLLKALGTQGRKRDSPADASFQEPDNSKELAFAEAKLYRECVGRLLYLAHTRPDVQFATCVLSGKMQAPTATSMKMLHRVVAYLSSVPEIGFLIRPARNEGCFGYLGRGGLEHGDTLVVESITDSDWAGCRSTRKSRSSIQLYVSGSMVASMVRSQKSVTLSSGEAEFVCMVSGACEGIYLLDCLRFLLGPSTRVVLRCRTDSAASRGISQRVGCGRVRHLHAGMLWIQESVQSKELEVGCIPGSDNPADVGTKPLGGPRLRELLYSMGAVTPHNEPYGKEDREAAVEKRTVAKALKDLSKSSGAKVAHIKAILPMLVLLTQVGETQGLGLAAPAFFMTGDEFVAQCLATLVVAAAVWFMVVWVPSSAYKGLKWFFAWLFQKRGESSSQSSSVATQANLGMSRDEKKFADEYVKRCQELKELLHERCLEVERCEEQLRRLHEENRDLRSRVDRFRLRREPQRIAVASARGQRFHLPTCHYLQNSHTREYTPCRDCIGA